MVKQNNNKKSGFSLVEALVSMLIMSVFFIASSKIITQRQVTEFQSNPHGYYECYYIDGQLMEHRVAANGVVAPKIASSCHFDPPKGVAFMNVHYINGTSSTTGYFNVQEPMLNEAMNISSPASILSDGNYADTEVYNNYLNDSYVADFHTYLEITHPSSQIYRNWDNILGGALFIAW